MGFISSSEFKIYILVVLAATVIAFSITLVVMLPGYLDSRKNLRQTSVPEGKISVDYRDFVVPDSYSRLIESRLYSYYDYKNKWNKEDVDRYWNDPKEMILEYLDTKNSSAIEEILNRYE